MEAAAASLGLNPHRLPVYSHERTQFRGVRDANVLCYFPHGFGDWVHFSRVLPFLEPSNRYWMTRYGDDNVALMDRCAYARPVYLGINGTQNGDGTRFANRHFGLDYDALDGSERELTLPNSLAEFCERERIDAMLWTSFPEPNGRVAYPYHTKSRNLLRDVMPLDGDKNMLARPLESSLCLQVDSFVTGWIEARLNNLLNLRGRKLCLIARTGFSSIGKNWGHRFREDLPVGRRREGEECRDFMRLMRSNDDRWTFLLIEDRLFEGDHTMRSRDLHAYSYAELFAALDQPMIPFGLVMKVLASMADLAVGVPVGPYHLCMTNLDLPTIGIWIEHFPSWFEEPREAAIHVISKNVRDAALDRMPGSFLTTSNLRYRGVYVETRIVTGEQVFAAAERLGAI